MGETANQIDASAVAVEGMEGLFEGQVEGAPVVVEAPPAEVEECPQENFEPTPSKMEGRSSSWSLKEAADNLGISINTVRKRLQQGLLDGFKEDGAYGPEWRIAPPRDWNHPPTQAEERATAAVEEPPTTVVGEDSRTFIRPYEETQSERLLRVVESQLELIGRLQNELALKDRLLIEKDSEIKLLVDTKKKPSWWQKLLGQE